MRRRLEAREHKISKPCDLTATVNDAVARGQFTLLSGEICLTRDRLITSKALVYKCLGSLECIAQRERTRCKPIALSGVTLPVIKQKSADGIVAKRSP